ncbi:MAG: HAMP domain-containing protein [Chloroflexi bacterium]|jgi:two-component system phosphate regulon sensor histidine kinase PhoR|nr:HAMP domain-containing protein [Chloroflexota bacterium]
MIHRNSRRQIIIYALVIAVVMLGLGSYLVRPACQNNGSCISLGVLGAAILEIVLITSFSFVNARRRSNSIREMSEMANQISEGDVNVRVLPHSRDEIGELARVINQITDSLRDRIGDLAEENRQLDIVLDNMADGVLIANDMGRIQFINTAAAKMLVSSETQALGRSFAEVARHHQLIDLWQICRDEGRVAVAAVEIGRGLFLQAYVTPFQEEGKLGYLVILQDLTKVRFLQTVRRDFVSNISHELRTPLASLRAVVETLQDGALEEPTVAHRFLDRAERELDTLTQMVEELLELSRIESGEVPLRLEPTVVSELIFDALDRLRPQAERERIEVKVQIADDVPLVSADSERMRRVVANLLHNAIKFTPERGNIQIAARLNDGVKPDAEVIFSVRDNGTGIAVDDLPRIFERFYKSDRARTRGQGGTGLGLAIARHLVEAHGGRIWAKSKEGKGSTFFFTLPVSQRPVNKTLTNP